MTRVLVAALACCIAIAGCPEEPTADKVRPFTYLLKPHDTIGFKDCPQAFQIAPDGALVTTWGQFHLWVGAPPAAVDQRTRYPRNGYLPMLSFEVVRGEVYYTFEAFAAPHGLDPRENLVAYVTVTADNRGDEAATANAELMWGPKPDDGYRALLICEAWYCDTFQDAAAWDGKAPTSMRDDGVIVQANHVIARLADVDRVAVRLGEGTAAFAWEWALEPGEAASSRLLVPFVPIALDRPSFVDRFLTMPDHATAQAEAESFWEEQLTQGMVVTVDEPKVTNTSKMSLAYNMIARDISADGTRITQSVGENMYHEFWSRDSAFFARVYNMYGRPELARSTLEHFVMRDPDDVAVGIHRFYPDDWGQSLWAIGAHVRSTGDDAFASELVAAVVSHVAAFEAEIATDEWEMWPAQGPYDNEYMEDDHYTGHSFWALLGLREAAYVATTAGEFTLAADIDAVRIAYRTRLDQRLAAATAQTGGYIPPGLDDPLVGRDWANAGGGVYPFGVLAPDDPRVTSTLALLRPAKYREGLLFYGTNAFALAQGEPVTLANLHAYVTHYVTETLLARGEQRAVVEDFYAILAHSSSTHGGFEHSLRPWGSRDAGWNRGPHGWWAARYNELLRNMLVREGIAPDDEGTLHIASAVSPVWAASGKSITVERAATFFGTINRMDLAYTDHGVTVAIDAQWRQAPSKIVVHTPFWSDGVATTFSAAEASAGPLEVPFEWQTAPNLSYDRAVEVLEAGFLGGPQPNVLLASE